LSRDTHPLIWSLMINKENKKSPLFEVSSFPFIYDFERVRSKIS